MDGRWLILADDLTGAADAAIAFARRGLRTEVTWGERAAGDFLATSVLAYDCDSRRLSAAEAGAQQARAAARFLPGASAIYKKIDSTLRGQPAAEIAALCAGLQAPQPGAFGVFAPANPAMGRTTRDGRVFVHDEPLENTETWSREHSYESADLVAMLAGAGLRAIKLPLAEVRAGGAALQAAVAAAAASAAAHVMGTILVCDAETPADLARIVAAARTHGGVRFFIGTAGLANALAESLPSAARQPVATAASRHGALIVVGSLASAARAAACALAALPGLRQVRFSARMLLEADAGTRTRMALDIRGALERGIDVLVEMPPDEAPDLSIGPALARALATTLSPAFPRMSGLIVTGGETAAALLRQCYVGHIRLIDEIEAGTALGLMVGETSLPLITKPGAFGDSHSLVRALEKLRLIRLTGTVA